ncbi:MAG TPA: sporulation protein YabP [Bacillota bacterium]
MDHTHPGEAMAVADERMVDPGPGSGRRDGSHQLQIVNRERLQVSGVLHVDSFDDRQIVLDTDLGTLTVQGEDLQIKQLDLDSGRFAVEGLLSAITYSSGAGTRDKRGKSLLERLLR